MSQSQQPLKIWIDGKLVEKDAARVSVYDHGLLYGDGVFEGIRVYSGKIFECEAHLKRLYDSAKAIRLTIPITQAKKLIPFDQTYWTNWPTDANKYAPSWTWWQSFYDILTAVKPVPVP